MVLRNLPVGISSYILKFGEFVKVRESLHTWVIIWINTIPNHIDTREILPRHEGFCMVCRPQMYQNKNTWVKYPYFNGIKD